eukprot:403331138
MINNLKVKTNFFSPIQVLECQLDQSINDEILNHQQLSQREVTKTSQTLRISDSELNSMELSSGGVARLSTLTLQNKVATEQFEKIEQLEFNSSEDQESQRSITHLKRTLAKNNSRRTHNYSMGSIKEQIELEDQSNKSPLLHIESELSSHSNSSSSSDSSISQQNFYEKNQISVSNQHIYISQSQHNSMKKQINVLSHKDQNEKEVTDFNFTSNINNNTLQENKNTDINRMNSEVCIFMDSLDQSPNSRLSLDISQIYNNQDRKKKVSMKNNYMESERLFQKDYYNQSDIRGEFNLMKLNASTQLNNHGITSPLSGYSPMTTMRNAANINHQSFFNFKSQRRSQPDRKSFSVSIRTGGDPGVGSSHNINNVGNRSGINRTSSGNQFRNQPKKHKSFMVDQMSYVSNYLSNESNYNNMDLKESLFRPRRKTSQCTIHDMRQEHKEYFLRGIDLGSPIPANEILMSFQKQRRSSARNNQIPILGSGSPSLNGMGSLGLKTSRSPKMQSPSSNKKPISHFKKPSESSLPPEFFSQSDNPMKCSEYKDLTLHIFHSINQIKKIREKPDIEEEQYVDFKFKKPNFKKLIIFDLDETLIHVLREAEDLQVDEDEEFNEEDQSGSSSSVSAEILNQSRCAQKRQNLEDNQQDLDAELNQAQSISLFPDNNNNNIDQNQDPKDCAQVSPQQQALIDLYNFNNFVPDIWIDIKDEETGEEVKAGFTIRPYALECLKYANQFYEVAIFTAGNQWFADPIIDYLDPKGELIQHRFFRQHTTYVEDQCFFVKDLRILRGIDPKDIVIVDNYVYSFAFQLENGIPIVPFYGDKKDKEMIKLIKYLKHIHKEDDLRECNEMVFQLNRILESNIEQFIQYYSLDKITEDYSDEGSSYSSFQSEELSELHTQRQIQNADQEEVKIIENLILDTQNSLIEQKRPKPVNRNLRIGHSIEIISAIDTFQDETNKKTLRGESGGTPENIISNFCESCGTFKTPEYKTNTNNNNYTSQSNLMASNLLHNGTRQSKYLQQRSFNHSEQQDKKSNANNLLLTCKRGLNDTKNQTTMKMPQQQLQPFTNLSPYYFTQKQTQTQFQIQQLDSYSHNSQNKIAVCRRFNNNKSASNSSTNLNKYQSADGVVCQEGSNHNSKSNQFKYVTYNSIAQSKGSKSKKHPVKKDIEDDLNKFKKAYDKVYENGNLKQFLKKTQIRIPSKNNSKNNIDLSLISPNYNKNKGSIQEY